MIISVGKNNVIFEPVEVTNFDELASIVTSKNYSCGVFKNNYRNMENFIKADAIALDFDGGVRIDEVVTRANEYIFGLFPTKSHRKIKNGKVADRFRLIFPLEETIDNKDDYYATYESLLDLFPEADPSCKDPSRQYFSSTGVYKINRNGARIPKKKGTPRIEALMEPPKEKGQLSRLTLNFLLFGAEVGTRHARLFKACKDAQENGYTKEEFTTMISKMISDTGTWDTPEPSAKDLTTINDAFSGAARHSAREIETEVITFKKINELSNKKVEWVASKLLSRGGLSILAGPPKSGKSTLTKQLALAVSRGETFLNRKCRQGPVLYLALEEQEEVLSEQLKQIGVDKSDPLYLHVGGVREKTPVDDLFTHCELIKPALIVIDTLMLFCKTQNINDYSEMNKELEKIRMLGRQTGAHVLCIHHMNKSRESHGTDTILGSAAIHGAVDSAILFKKEGGRRFIETSQRYGKSFDNEELIYMPEKNIYVLGKRRSVEEEMF